jgi:hypothetical protein
LKKNKILLPILIVFALFLSSCESSLNNTFTFRNLSAGKLLINFRASVVEVPVDKTVTIKDVPKGTYSFSTTYEVPAGVISSTVQGDASGNVTFKQNTKVLVLYSSTLSEDSTYTLYAALTSSEDLSTDENPTGP